MRLIDNHCGRTCDRTTGRLEIFLRGQWGTVCNDSFGDVEAVLACNQLGYSSLEDLFAAGTGVSG